MILLSLAHFLVDGVCASALYSMSHDSIAMFILLYNTLAFTGQAVWGLLADRFPKQKYGTAVSCLLVCGGALLPLPVAVRTVLLGVGNCGFHVGGGTRVLREHGKKAAPLGIFVAPGSVGLALGTLWPGLRLWLTAGLLLSALGILLQKEAAVKPETEGEKLPFWVPLVLLLAVAVRSFGGFAVAAPWKTAPLHSLLAVAAVFLGKTAGGFLADRFGIRKAALISLPVAAVLLGFFGGYMIPSLLGQLLLNLTMPVTLWLIYRGMPDAPGLSFGLAAASLWPGALAAKAIPMEGFWGNAVIFLTFAGGTAAILAANRALQRRHTL